MRQLIFASAVLLALIGCGQQPAEPDIANALCAFGCPVGAPASNDTVSRDIYILSSNKDTKFADWVAYTVSNKTIGTGCGRNWRPDPDLSDSETLEPSDYKGAHNALETDRGHQAPLASLCGTGKAYQTNFLSNITPQKSDLNQGPWRELEEAIRDYVMEREARSVKVVTGPLYERDMPPLPGADEPHQVPSGYWKVVLVMTGDTFRTASFIFDQDTPRSADFCTFIEPIARVEARSGLRLFPELPDDKALAVKLDTNNFICEK